MGLPLLGASMESGIWMLGWLFNTKPTQRNQCPPQATKTHNSLIHSRTHELRVLDCSALFRSVCDVTLPALLARSLSRPFGRTACEAALVLVPVASAAAPLSRDTKLARPLHQQPARSLVTTETSGDLPVLPCLIACLPACSHGCLDCHSVPSRVSAVVGGMPDR